MGMELGLGSRVLSFRNGFSKVAQASLGDKAYMLEYCLKSRAWKDAVAYERRVSGSEVIRNKEAIIDVLRKELTENTADICDDFDAWHHALCSRTDYGMRYGVWQKFINMAFKNLYCVKELFPEFDGVWEKCHCPIDSIIAKKVYPMLLEMGISEEEAEPMRLVSVSGVMNWNNLTAEDYAVLCALFAKVCKKKGCTSLELDFCEWDA